MQRGDGGAQRTTPARRGTWQLLDALEDVDRALRVPITSTLMLRARAEELAGNPHAFKALALHADAERIRSGPSRRLLKVSNLILQVIQAAEKRPPPTPRGPAITIVWAPPPSSR